MRHGRLKRILSYSHQVLYPDFPTLLKVLALRMMGSVEPVTVTLGDVSIKIRPATPDLQVAMFSLGDEFSALARVLPSNFRGLLVDAGGFIGTAAIKLAMMYPEATVVTVEPAANNYRLLLDNVCSHPAIRPINAALVAPGHGPAMLSDRGTGPWGYTIVDHPRDRPDARRIGSVQTITLRQIRDLHAGAEIGLLKLDIEGAERELFATDPAEMHAARVVVAELHDKIVEGCATAFEDFSRDRIVIDLGSEKHVSLRTG